ncbi:MAG: type II toxin-antitoxin system Phd/YefM family antitoxin [Deltaproteobacteria bacterium]|nr:type II toxin-antitoxin system Phd/YefM family antitoxin [Deltaproteobacteria bacterium]
MKKMGAGEFKAKCLAVLDSVAKEHETVYITKRGKLVAALVPPPETNDDLVASLRGSVVFEDDIVSPVDEKWEVGE